MSTSSAPRPLSIRESRDDRVVVVGGSLGGLLAAAALARSARSVVVLERDALPDDAAPRPGTPQVAHAHGLLASGREAMERLLPGLTDELVASGAVVRGDVGRNGRWWVGGGLFADCDLGMTGVAVSRPLLEAVVRRRVRALPGVEVRDRVDVLGLVPGGSGRRVAGVRVRERDDRPAARGRSAAWPSGGRTPAADPEVSLLTADLVVDASGRSGRAARWFAEHGWPAPREDRVGVGVRYATAHLPHRPGDLADRSVAVSAATPEVPRGGVAIRQEGARWVVTLFGYAEEPPPLDPDGFRAYARTVVSPDLAELLDGRELAEPPRAYRFPDCRRRRFERLDVPLGYAAVGDAICSFDPTFGQGMSVAALEAVQLGAAAAEGLERVRRRYHREAAAIVDRAWTIVVGADLLLAGVEGRRPPGHAVLSRYVRRAQRAARHDPAVARACLRVTNLVDPPAALLRPGIAARVLATGRPAAVPAPAPVGAARS